MTITIGRGRKRNSIELPTGESVAAYAKTDPVGYRAALDQVCSLLNIV